VLAEVLVIALELVDCEETGDAFEQCVRTLAFLEPLSGLLTMLKS
jgi:hypothetical protein